MERIEYSKNMAETTETDLSPRGNSRRNFINFIKKGLIAGGAAFVLDTGLNTLGNLLAFQTQAQKEAQVSLNDPNTVQVKYRVKDAEEIRRNNGVNVNDQPIPALKGDPPAKWTLQPGSEIQGVSFFGRTPEHLGSQGLKQAWIAFKDPSGRVGFVAEKYLEEIK